MNRRAALVVAASLAPAAAHAATSWNLYGRDPQHSARAGRSAQAIESIHWQAPVDLAPQFDGNDLLIHYGTPLVTARNTVVFPVKTGAAGGFRVDARNGATGAPLWSFDTDYVLPDHGWTPSCGACLGPSGSVVVPASGGTLLVRPTPDAVGVAPTRVAFYGIDNYSGAQKATFDQTVFVCSPVTCDAHGTLYFAFHAGTGAPLSLASGFARIPTKGASSWIRASDAAGDATIVAPAMNSAPAVSRDGRTLYVVVRDDDGTGNGGAGYLCALDAKTLKKKAATHLLDVLEPGATAGISDDGTSSPTVAPDGDVYIGVLENSLGANDFRGWLLHFDAALAHEKTPGSFGWDDTPSIVPRSAVPSYKGRSSYLVLTKYNDYAEGGGTGVNQVALLDPKSSQVDPRSGATTMREVLVIAGPTPDPDFRDAQHPDAVREWCINSAAVDAKGRCALVNNEDGVLYRWDFRTNTLSQNVVLTPGVGEAYTPTVVGPEGTVYAINDATLFAVGAKPK